MKILKFFLVLSCLSVILHPQTLILDMNDGSIFNFDLTEIDSITFTNYAPGSCPPTVYYGGKIYNTVNIEGQCWLKENLNAGTMIPGTDNPSDNSVIEKYCLENDLANCELYGGLYSWSEAMQYIPRMGTRGICPPGWHIPTLSDYEKLINSVLYDGNALKEIGQGTGSGEGTNSSGFSALLAGYRYPDGNFYDLGINAFFWSSVYSEDDAFYMHLKTTKGNIYLNQYNTQYGFSVRCIKD